jgi:hypothetical protein
MDYVAAVWPGGKTVKHMTRWARSLGALLVTVPFAIAATTSAVVATAPAASAEDNGVGLTLAMGWSSWSFIRHDPTEAGIEAQARAMHVSGLQSVGYQYANVDDFWYQCPGSQGPDVDSYGRWVIDSTRFPPDGSLNGIAATARYVHHLGLKFGLYVTPGISKQAVEENTPIEGTSYTADDIAEPSVSENNYNCGGMAGIDYSKPGAQQFIDSWADEFASWGVDYVKLDGVGSFDVPDVQAWSQALEQTGRPIHLELSNSLNINDASVWQEYSNGWRTGGDIECYGCESGGSSYPLTDWANVESRFAQVAAWQPTVPAQAATQDAGMFVTSHAAGSPGEVTFNGLTVSGTATTPSLATAYQAANPANTFAGGAVAQSCSTCYGGEKVGFVGEGGTLTLNDVTVPAAGTYDVTLVYCDGSSTGRQADVSADGGAPQLLSFTPTGSFTTVGAMTVSVPLTAGANTIELGNPAAYAPDFDEIIVAAAAS